MNQYENGSLKEFKFKFLNALNCISEQKICEFFAKRNVSVVLFQVLGDLNYKEVLNDILKDIDLRSICDKLSNNENSIICEIYSTKEAE